MNIRPTSERYVYDAESDSHPGEWHRCDLLANNGAGECACRDFQTRRQPAIRKGALSLTPDTTCRHLRAAHTHFLRGILVALAKEENNGP